MSGVCRRCSGAGFLFRNPETMTAQQRARALSCTGFASWITPCTDCARRGVRGRL